MVIDFPPTLELVILPLLLRTKPATDGIQEELGLTVTLSVVFAPLINLMLKPDGLLCLTVATTFTLAVEPIAVASV